MDDSGGLHPVDCNYLRDSRFGQWHGLWMAYQRSDVRWHRHSFSNDFSNTNHSSFITDKLERYCHGEWIGVVELGGTIEHWWCNGHGLPRRIHHRRPSVDDSGSVPSRVDFDNLQPDERTCLHLPSQR